MINIDCLEIEQKKKLYKILRENENDTERIIEEGKNYFGPWKSYDGNIMKPQRKKKILF